MEMNEKVDKEDIPVCHSEPMIPVERFKEDGRIIVRYECGMPYCNETIDIMVKTPEEKKEIRDSLDLFNYMWKFAGEDP